jgi:hypothetical protein
VGWRVCWAPYAALEQCRMRLVHCWRQRIPHPTPPWCHASCVPHRHHACTTPRCKLGQSVRWARGPGCPAHHSVCMPHCRVHHAVLPRAGVGCCANCVLCCVQGLWDRAVQHVGGGGGSLREAEQHRDRWAGCHRQNRSVRMMQPRQRPRRAGRRGGMLHPSMQAPAT